MRIDLIPDVPADSMGGTKERVVITTQKRRTARHHAKTGDLGDVSRFDELLQSMYDAALVTDASGRVVDANVRAVDFLMYERDALLGLTALDIISGADESLIHTLWANLERERFVLIQAYCVRRDGTYFPTEIAVNKLRLGEMHLCFFIRDITLRRQAEEMLRTEHNAIQNSGNGIAVADLHARLEYVNPAVGRMWEYSDTDALLGRDVRVLLDEEGEGEIMLGTVMHDLVPWSGEMRVHRVDGAAFDVQVNAAPNRNSDGDPVGVVFSFVDISDRKRAERAVREAERQRVMLESLGAACHHLSQPATILLANLGILKRITDGAQSDRVELIDSSIGAAETLGEILHKLIAVNEYKTVQYLQRPERGEDPDAPVEEDRILDI